MEPPILCLNRLHEQVRPVRNIRVQRVKPLAQNRSDASQFAKTTPISLKNGIPPFGAELAPISVYIPNRPAQRSAVPLSRSSR